MNIPNVVLKTILILWLLGIFQNLHSQTRDTQQQLIEAKERKATLYRVANGTSNLSPTNFLMSSPEQDCSSAIPVCNNTYTQTNSYSGVGNSNEIPSNSSCLGSNEKNSVWYIFNVSQTGNFNFQINPLAQDDYDFALYNISNKNCSDINSGAVTPSRCSFAAGAGATGLNTSATDQSEGASGDRFVQELNVTIGETYVLVVSNYSDSQSGYNLNFGGTAQIFDNSPPQSKDVYASCGASSLLYRTNEQVTCGSIASDGSDFTITGTGGPYTVTAASGVNCGTSTNEINITITPALSGIGPWNINVIAGSDGNTLIDNCTNPMLPNSLQFVTGPPVGVITGPTNACLGSSVALQAASGATWAWTGPNGFTATTQTINVNTQTAGSYTYNVTISSGICGTANASHQINIEDGSLADFTINPNPVCVGQQVTFSNTTLHRYTCSLSGSVCDPGASSPCGFLGVGGNCRRAPINANIAYYDWNYGDGNSDSWAGIFAGWPGTSSLSDPTVATHTFTIPGTYTITLQAGLAVGGGCNTSKAIDITVLPNTNTLTVRNNSTICEGDTFNLVANGGASYTWKDGTGSVIGTTRVLTVTPTTTTTYTVESPGCGGISQTKSLTVTVKPFNSPVITPTIISTCTGSSLTITSSNPGDWTSKPTGFSQNNTSSISVNPLVNTTYYVTASNNGCTGKDSVKVTVGGTPFTINNPILVDYTCGSSPASGSIQVSLTGNTGTANLILKDSITGAQVSTGNITGNNAQIFTTLTGATYELSVTANGCTQNKYITIKTIGGPTITLDKTDQSICAGDSILVTASGGITYNWTPLTGVKTPTSAQTYLKPTTTTTYTVTGSNNSCSSAKTIKLTVNTAPTITVNPLTTSVCDGDSVAITLTGASTYTWQPTVGVIQGNTSTYLKPTINTSYVVTGTNANGCKDTVHVNITVNPSPVINISANKTNICQDSTTILTATGATNYTWSPITGLNISSGAVIQAKPQTTITYEVTGSIPGNICSRKEKIRITVIPKPTADAGPDLSICEGQSAILFGSGGNSYIWSPGKELNDSSLSSPTASPNVTTDYYLTVARNGCLDKDTVNIKVYPVIPILASKDTTLLYGEKYTMKVTGGVAPYIWIPKDSLSCTSCDKVIATPTKTTDYIVSYTDANGCVIDDTVRITVRNDFGIYIPNAYTPDDNGLNDKFNAVVWGVKDFELKIYDKWGTAVYSGNISDKGWDGTLMNSGGDECVTDVYVYVLEVTPNNSSKIKKTGTVTLLK